jgi:hypothetical protein
MTLEQAAVFFTGSILTMLGFIVITAGVIAINNLLHRYWKPVKFAHYEGPRFIEENTTKEKHE